MSMGEAIRLTATGVSIALRVTPRSSRTTVGEVRDGRLLVRVTAAPVDDAANQATVRAIASALDVPRSQVRLTGGLTSRNKTIEVSGRTLADVRRALIHEP